MALIEEVQSIIVAKVVIDGQWVEIGEHGVLSRVGFSKQMGI